MWWTWLYLKQGEEKETSYRFIYWGWRYGVRSWKNGFSVGCEVLWTSKTSQEGTILSLSLWDAPRHPFFPG